VAHIERQSGRRGGEFWFLTLACGHHAVKRIRPYRIYYTNLSQVAEAPKKMRCLSCHLDHADS